MQDTNNIEKGPFHDPFPHMPEQQQNVRAVPQLLGSRAIEQTLWDFEIEWPGHPFGD